MQYLSFSVLRHVFGVRYAVSVLITSLVDVGCLPSSPLNLNMFFQLIPWNRADFQILQGFFVVWRLKTFDLCCIVRGFLDLQGMILWTKSPCD